jgi:hypothetical protein
MMSKGLFGNLGGKNIYINPNGLLDKLLSISYGARGPYKEKQKTVGNVLFFGLGEEHLFLFSMMLFN